MTQTTASELKQAAITALGADEVQQLSLLPITETHRRYSEAYRCFDDAKAKAYASLLTVLMLGIR
jgi:hypothetical protein